MTCRCDQACNGSLTLKKRELKKKPALFDYGSNGFTLIEIIVVVMIIGLLAALVAPRFFGKVDQSKLKTTQAQIELFGLALDHFMLDVGRYPTSQEGIEALRKTPDNVKKWRGPYLKKDIPRDPWGNAYFYLFPGDHGDYDIISYGGDGQSGGEGKDQDIVSWRGLK